MEILSHIDYPEDLRKLNRNELKQLAEELRQYLLEIIPRVGGHFASSLGVVELTIALHYVYNTPRDLLIWDVGHQAYAHKVLTGRREALQNIRQLGGISGFLKREESPYDVFGAGHASTSISAALGFATARDLQGEDYKVVAVIGDGSLTGGLAYEGLNNAGQSRRNMLVILNDNNMSISPNVGAIANYLNAIITNPFYQKIKNQVWDLTAKIPPLTDKIRSLARKTQESIKSLILPGMFFEDLGFRYFGPVNGHDLDELLTTLKNIKDLPGPILLHVLTKKGKGYLEAEKYPHKYHGIKPITSAASSGTKKETFLSYTQIFGKTMIQLAEKTDRLCAITAAMSDGTGLSEFAEKFPERFFDVGIAEGHAVTFAAGLAANGMRPVAAIYSTFLQRAYDQIIHDVALQKLPVIFALDRGGLVGEDGPTHHGNFDLTYLNTVPDLILTAPKNGQELRDLLFTALTQDRYPFAIRYPRDKAPDLVDFQQDFQKIAIGSWEVVEEGKDVLILAVGAMVSESQRAARILQSQGIQPTIVNCRFIKPIDGGLLNQLLARHHFVFTIEENSIEGGFGSKIARFMKEHHISLPLFTRGIPDEFIEHGPRHTLLEMCGLTSDKIAEWILEEINLTDDKPISRQKTSRLRKILGK